MSALNFFADNGAVYMRDGPWSSRLTQAQCDCLLDIWDECNAVSAFNCLYDAVQAAGYLPPIITNKALRRPALVVDNTAQGVVRHMLAASVDDMLAGQSLERQP